MALELNDGKITGSSGVAKAGLTLGIIGTSLAALSGMQNGTGIFGGGSSEKTNDELYQLRAEKYADGINFDLYTRIVALGQAEDAKIAAVQNQLWATIVDLDKRTALNEQAQRLNREYDNTVRDYMMTIVNNKIDCCCDRMTMQASYEKEISELADAAILSYVNSTFIPGKLSLPASSITPAVVLK